MSKYINKTELARFEVIAMFIASLLLAGFTVIVYGKVYTVFGSVPAIGSALFFGIPAVIMIFKFIKRKNT